MCEIALSSSCIGLVPPGRFRRAAPTARPEDRSFSQSVPAAPGTVAVTTLSRPEPDPTPDRHRRSRPATARPGRGRRVVGVSPGRRARSRRRAGDRGPSARWPAAQPRCGRRSCRSRRARWGTRPIPPTPTATSSAPTGTRASTTAATTTSTRSGAPTSQPGCGSRPGRRSTYQLAPGYLNGNSASFYVWGVDHGTWHPVGSGYTPQPGDVAVYGLDTTAVTAVHVAVVTAATGNDGRPTSSTATATTRATAWSRSGPIRPSPT